VPLVLATLIVRSGAGTRYGHVLERRRGFLGALKVVELHDARILTHGRIRHGMQLSAAELCDRPTMYYGPGTAVDRLFAVGLPLRPRRIGVLGLGVGTLAAFGRRGDVVRFYELSPDVIAINRRWFTFLADSHARIELAVGDGRLLLAHEPSQHFDLLALDAFSSDAVPAHLLTREAFAIYLRHLAHGGVLLVNVANRYLQLDRVVRAVAHSYGLATRFVATPADDSHWTSSARWGVVASSEAELDRLLGELAPAADGGGEVLWTDERTSLWPILR
jgi:SAM-dependent methyltransferase